MESGQPGRFQPNQRRDVLDWQNLGEVLRAGDLVLNVDAHTVTRSARLLRLTATEFRRLEYFMADTNRVLLKH